MGDKGYYILYRPFFFSSISSWQIADFFGLEHPFVCLTLFCLIFRLCQGAVNLYLAVLSTMMDRYLHIRYVPPLMFWQRMMIDM